MFIINYFWGGKQGDEEGNIDLEWPYRVDIKLFQEQMKLLSEGKTADVPVFDFVVFSYVFFRVIF